ncbi:MAG: hypothetical protein V1676_06980 [Candidatus Diapherotrites archaeon]
MFNIRRSGATVDFVDTGRNNGKLSPEDASKIDKAREEAKERQRIENILKSQPIKMGPFHRLKRFLKELQFRITGQ